MRHANVCPGSSNDPESDFLITFGYGLLAAGMLVLVLDLAGSIF